jgi:hypothetical protein
LIGQLRDQLEDLEQFAYEVCRAHDQAWLIHTMQMGDSGPPSTMVMEKQRLIIEQLRERIELDVDGFDSMPPDELQKAVDQVSGQLFFGDTIFIHLGRQAADPANACEGATRESVANTDHRFGAFR